MTAEKDDCLNARDTLFGEPQDCRTVCALKNRIEAALALLADGGGHLTPDQRNAAARGVLLEAMSRIPRAAVAIRTTNFIRTRPR